MNLKMNLKNKITLKDYEKIEKHFNQINKYTLALILSGFGLGVLVGGMRRKIKAERKSISNKYEKNKSAISVDIEYKGSELERLVEKMIDRLTSSDDEDRKYTEEKLLNDDSIDVKDYLEWCDKYKK